MKIYKEVKMFSLETKKKILSNTELFVLDMDGTFYLENDILDGSLDFLEAVKRAGKRYIFFTNNSSQLICTQPDAGAR